MKLAVRNKAKEGNSNATVPEVFSKLQTEMDRIFNRFFQGDWSAPMNLFGAKGAWGPSVDVIDGEKEVIVKADLPGVEPKEFDISLSGNLLTISGEKKEFHEEKGKDFFRSERHVGAFRRCVELPTGVNSEKVTADYKNGVLTVRLEKVESEKPRKITVR